MTGYDLSAWPLFRSVIDSAGETAAKAQSCLFVSPFSDPQPDVRRHADAVWKYIVRPALLDTSYAGRRIESVEAGVPQAAVDGVLDDDLVIALLSFRNPDVFYQIAIAQAAGRRLVVMIEDGRDIAFDPRGARVVTYSLDTETVFSGENVRRLQAAIAEVAASPAPAQPFRPGGVALNGGGHGGATIFERSRLVSYDLRLDMIRVAKTRVDMMGVANMALALHPDAMEVIRSKSGAGVEFRILQCAPTNPGLMSLMNTRDLQRFEAVKQEIEIAAEAWKRIVDTPGVDVSITMRRAQTLMPLASALITDSAVVATPYLASRVTAESPTLMGGAGSAYHAVMSQEFDALWSEAAPLFRADARLMTKPSTPANGNALPQSNEVVPFQGARSFTAS